MNAYQILGVPKNASQDDIKVAYRKLAKQFHPDLNPGNKKAEAKFKELSSAYELIGTADARLKFDQGEAAAASQAEGPFYSDTQAGPGARYAENFGNIDPDIFASIFGGSFRGGPVPKADQHFEMEVNFRDSILGTETDIQLPGGAKLRVKIPPGIHSGAQLRLQGVAAKSRENAVPGDVYVKINVKPSPQFKRVEKDLETELSVSFEHALLGAEVKIPTLEGPVLLKIPSGASTGSRLRLRGKGVPGAGSEPRGDLFAILKITIPGNLDEELKEAIRSWQKRQAKAAPPRTEAA